MIEEAYINLQAAIIEQAAVDYLAALRKDSRGEARALERFFRSEWGQALSRDNGEEIIKRVREEARKEKGNGRKTNVRKNNYR